MDNWKQYYTAIIYCMTPSPQCWKPNKLWANCEAWAVKPAVWSASAASCGTCRAKREVRNVSPKERRPQMIRIPSWTIFTWSPGCPLVFEKIQTKFSIDQKWYILKINFRIKYLFHPISSTFKQLSIQSSFMSRSHMISKVLHISAFFLANITMENLPSWTVFTWTPRCHLLQESLLHTSH